MDRTATPLHVQQIALAEIHALYVHIPFCFHKCHYCDFYSITRQTPQRMQGFVDLILREADQWIANGRHVRPRTIFFGGGTPSLLPAEAMQRLIHGLGERFDLSGVEEFTIEINPATAQTDYLRMLRSMGVNRLSFGAQSFHPAELTILERHHHPEDVPASLAMARDAGFLRLNIDLIYAIPGQSIDDWQDNLDRALSLQIDHLSCYGLTYESNTPMAVRKRMGQFAGADEDLELQMFRSTRERLERAGMPWYEISNFAAAGNECQHNLIYWTGGNYIGLGPSAASHVEGHRFKNRPHLGEWEAAVPLNYLPVIEHEKLSMPQRACERIMLGLRLKRGVRFDDLLRYEGFDVRKSCAETMDRLRHNGLIRVDNDGFYLTDAGLNVADGVAGEFAWVE